MSTNDKTTTPAWLLTDENYTPAPDKDAFMDKSILALLGVIAKIRSQGRQPGDRFHVGAQWKVLFTLVLVVLISLTQSAAFLTVSITYLLLVLCTMRANEILSALKISIFMALVTFLLLLPAAFFHAGYNPVMIPVKVFSTVLAVNLLSRSARFDSIVSALKGFFIPDIFIFVLDITIKYILMLGEFCLSMLSALKLRSVGKNKHKYTALSGIAGTMFLKSGEMAEELHMAMECRGFTGQYRIKRRIAFTVTLADGVYFAINAILIFSYFYLNRG